MLPAPRKFELLITQERMVYKIWDSVYKIVQNYKIIIYFSFSKSVLGGPVTCTLKFLQFSMKFHKITSKFSYSSISRVFQIFFPKVLLSPTHQHLRVRFQYKTSLHHCSLPKFNNRITGTFAAKYNFCNFHSKNGIRGPTPENFNPIRQQKYLGHTFVTTDFQPYCSSFHPIGLDYSSTRSR